MGVPHTVFITSKFDIISELKVTPKHSVLAEVASWFSHLFPLLWAIGSLAVGWDHVTEFQPMECEWRWGVPLAGLVHKHFPTLFPSVELEARVEHGRATRWKESPFGNLRGQEINFCCAQALSWGWAELYLSQLLTRPWLPASRLTL